MASLGDILSSAATGKDPDYQMIEQTAMLKGAQFQEAMAGVPLRGAQTQEALNNAELSRLKGIAAKYEQDEKEKLGANLAKAGVANSESLGHIVGAGGTFDSAAAGMGHVQEQDLVSKLSDPNSSPDVRLGAASGLKHEVQSPYVKIDPDYVDVRTPGAPGAPAPDKLSTMGEAILGNKNADTGLKLSKIQSTDASIDPNEIAYHAHLANNDPTYRPNFGMGQSATRQAFLLAQYLDASGIPITAESLHIAAGRVAHGFAAPAAPAAAPPAAGMTVGGGGARTPNNPLDHQIPADVPNPADNAPAGMPTPPAAAAPAVATPTVFKPTDFNLPANAILPPPLTPQDAADMVAARRGDVKAAQGTLTKTSGQLALVQSFENTANRNFSLLMEYANKLDNTGSPLINKAINDWNQGITGDKLTGQFVSTFQALHDEYAKILSGATGASGATEGGNKRADEVFNRNMNIDTLRGLADTIPREMGNRRVGYVGVMNVLRDQLRGKGTGLAGKAGADAAADTASVPSANPGGLPPAAAAALKPGKITHFGNGQSWRIGADGKPEQVK